MARSVLPILLLLGLLGFGTTTRCPKQKTSPGREILCYTTSYDIGRLNDSICRCTTLVHQGHNIQNLSVSDVDELRKTLKEMNPALQFVISVSDPIGSLKSTATKRQETAIRLASLLNEVDGVELNITAGSKERLHHFVKGLRDELVRKSKDKRILMALPTKSEDIAKQFDLKELTKYVDLFTISTHYLMDTDEAYHTFHPSRLMGIFDMLNTDSLVDLIHGLGVPKRKILITVPSSAYKFTLKNVNENVPRSSTIGREPNVIDRTELCNAMNNGEWTVERDEDLTAPYAFKDNTWIAFEDKLSVGIKGKYVILRELSGIGIYNVENDKKTNCGLPLTHEIYHSFTDFKRKTREAVLTSLEDDLQQPQFSYPSQVRSSEFRITRVVDTEGNIQAIRENTQTEFSCTRQGYFVHPRSCNRFYRCVKFNQEIEDYSVFEFDCPAGLAFDERTEVCVWPGSLPEGSPCPGSSEIAPTARTKFRCPDKPGYYADPQNCRWFYACMDLGGPEMTAYEFRCPYGLVFDEEKLECGWPWLVRSCQGSGPGYTRNEYGGFGSGHSGTGFGGQGGHGGLAGVGEHSGGSGFSGPSGVDFSHSGGSFGSGGSSGGFGGFSGSGTGGFSGHGGGSGTGGSSSHGGGSGSSGSSGGFTGSDASGHTGGSGFGGFSGSGTTSSGYGGYTGSTSGSSFGGHTGTAGHSGAGFTARPDGGYTASSLGSGFGGQTVTAGHSGTGFTSTHDGGYTAGSSGSSFGGQTVTAGHSGTGFTGAHDGGYTAGSSGSSFGGHTITAGHSGTGFTGAHDGGYTAGSSASSFGGNTVTAGHSGTGFTGAHDGGYTAGSSASSFGGHTVTAGHSGAGFTAQPDGGYTASSSGSGFGGHSVTAGHSGAGFTASHDGGYTSGSPGSGFDGHTVTAGHLGTGITGAHDGGYTASSSGSGFGGHTVTAGHSGAEFTGAHDGGYTAGSSGSNFGGHTVATGHSGSGFTSTQGGTYTGAGVGGYDGTSQSHGSGYPTTSSSYAGHKVTSGYTGAQGSEFSGTSITGHTATTGTQGYFGSGGHTATVGTGYSGSDDSGYVGTAVGSHTGSSATGHSGSGIGSQTVTVGIKHSGSDDGGYSDSGSHTVTAGSSGTASYDGSYSGGQTVKVGFGSHSVTPTPGFTSSYSGVDSGSQVGAHTITAGSSHQTGGFTGFGSHTVTPAPHDGGYTASQGTSYTDFRSHTGSNVGGYTASIGIQHPGSHEVTPAPGFTSTYSGTDSGSNIVGHSSTAGTQYSGSDSTVGSGGYTSGGGYSSSQERGYSKSGATAGVGYSTVSPGFGYSTPQGGSTIIGGSEQSGSYDGVSGHTGKVTPGYQGSQSGGYSPTGTQYFGSSDHTGAVDQGEVGLGVEIHKTTGTVGYSGSRDSFIPTGNAVTGYAGSGNNPSQGRTPGITGSTPSGFSVYTDHRQTQYAGSSHTGSVTPDYSDNESGYSSSPDDGSDGYTNTFGSTKISQPVGHSTGYSSGYAGSSTIGSHGVTSGFGHSTGSVEDIGYTGGVRVTPAGSISQSSGTSTYFGSSNVYRHPNGQTPGGHFIPSSPAVGGTFGTISTPTPVTQDSNINFIHDHTVYASGTENYNDGVSGTTSSGYSNFGTQAGGLNITVLKNQFPTVYDGGIQPTVGYSVPAGFSHGSTHQGSISTQDSSSGTLFTHGDASGIVKTGSTYQGAISTGVSQPGFIHTGTGTPGYSVTGGVKTVYDGSAAPATITQGTGAPGVFLTGTAAPGVGVKGQSSSGVFLTGQTASGVSVHGGVQPNQYFTTPTSGYSHIPVTTPTSITSDGGYRTNEYYDNGGRSTIRFNNGYVTNKYSENDLPDIRPTDSTLPDTVVSGGRIEGTGGIILDKTFKGVTTQRPFGSVSSIYSTPGGFSKATPTKIGYTTVNSGGSGTYSISTGQNRPTFDTEHIGEKAFEGTGFGHTSTSQTSTQSGYTYSKPAIGFNTNPPSSPAPFSLPTSTPSPFLNVELHNAPSGTSATSPPISTFKGSGFGFSQVTSRPTVTPSVAYTTGPLENYKTTAFEAAKIPVSISTVHPVIDTGYKTIVSPTVIPVTLSTERTQYMGGISTDSESNLDIDVALHNTGFGERTKGFSSTISTATGYDYSKPSGPSFSTISGTGTQVQYASTGITRPSGGFSKDYAHPETKTPTKVSYPQTQQPEVQYLSSSTAKPVSETPSETPYTYSKPSFEGTYRPSIGRQPESQYSPDQTRFSTSRPSTQYSYSGTRTSSTGTYQYPTSTEHPEIQYLPSSTVSPASESSTEYSYSGTKRPLKVTYQPGESRKPSTQYLPSSTLAPAIGVTYREPFSIPNGGVTGSPFDSSKPGSPTMPDIARDEVEKLITNYGRGQSKYTPSMYDTQRTVSTTDSFNNEVTGKSYVSSTTPSPPAITTYHGGYSRTSTPAGAYDIATKSPKGRGKVIVKWSDLHPLLLNKLGAECTCKADPFANLRGPGTKLIESNRGQVDLSNYDDSEVYVDLENGKSNEYDSGDYSDYGSSSPVVIGATSPSSKGTRYQGRPSTTYLPSASSTASPNRRPALSAEISQIDGARDANPGVKGRGRSGKKLNLNAGSNKIGGEGAAFDRYGPGGLRGADEVLQGANDCARPGLFRHPKFCNKFYACHWDEWKKKFTLHVFNCPVHLSFDNNAGACNWPSKGPACQDDNLLV